LAAWPWRFYKREWQTAGLFSAIFYAIMCLLNFPITIHRAEGAGMSWYRCTISIHATVKDSGTLSIQLLDNAREHVHYFTKLGGVLHKRDARHELMEGPDITRFSGELGTVGGIFMITVCRELWRAPRGLQGYETAQEVRVKGRRRFRFYPPLVAQIMRYRDELTPLALFWSDQAGPEAEALLRQVREGLQVCYEQACLTLVEQLAAKERAILALEATESVVQQAKGASMSAQFGPHTTEAVRQVVKDVLAADPRAAVGG
jgi:hypothetical protein